MALTGIYMRALVRENGHLVLEGTETTADLREALRNLYSHTIEKCHFPALGVPIESLLLNPDVLKVGFTSKKSVVTVDMSDESL